MRLEPRSLRSKVARRIFVVFLVCAIIPFTGLLLLTYYQVGAFFKHRNQQQLQTLAKIIGMEIFERLTLLESGLRIIRSAALVSEGIPNTAAIEKLPFNPRDRWHSILLLSSTGERYPLLGQMGAVPKLSSSDQQSLAAGKALMKIIPTGGGKSRVFISVATKTMHTKPDILIGEVENSYLWDFENSRLLPDFVHLCISDQSGIRLTCDLEERTGVSIVDPNGRRQYEIASSWYLPLKFEFQLAGWNIALRTSNEGAFASVAAIKRPFFLGIVVSLGLSILLAIFSIRKRLVPVELLQEGTRRIAANDFSFRVNIRSNDEFEELANSVNAMAGQLGRQFHTLVTKADIDRAVLSLLNTDAIVQTVLRRVTDLFPCDAVSVLLFGGATSETDQFYVVKNGNGSAAQKENLQLARLPSTVLGRNEHSGFEEGLSRVEIRKGDSFLARHLAITKIPSVLSEKEVEGVNSESAGLDGIRAIMSAPLIIKGNVLAVLTFYSKERGYFDAEGLELLRNLTSQVAIAIYNAQLFETVTRQAAELEKSNKAKDEFLGIVSHELRTPLNVILGYLAMLHDGMLGELNEEQNRALGTVSKHSQELRGMIESIMETTWIQAGAIMTECRPVDLISLFDDLKSKYEVLSRRESVTLHWLCAADLPIVQTDRSKLMRILQNLINNAIKFTDEGDITISATPIPEQSLVEFRVEDTGIGIPEKSQAIIFEMFRQLDSSATRQFGGIGLGLYIVKKLAALIGANVSVNSAQGRGSIFTVTVPVVNDNTVPPSAGDTSLRSTHSKPAYHVL